MNEPEDDSYGDLLAGAGLGLVGGAVLCVPFYGFGPILAVSAGVLALGFAVRLLPGSRE